VNPVPGHRITTPYKKRGKYWSLGWHTGSDFAASVGTVIVSATPGTVIAANAYDRSYGYKVIIRWGKYDVWYCHMRYGYATVRVGETVKAGEQIGKVGDVGNITGPHLHMELRTAGAGFAASSFHDPQIAIDYQEDDVAISKEDRDAIAFAVQAYKNERLETRDIYQIQRDTDATVKRLEAKIDALTKVVEGKA